MVGGVCINTGTIPSKTLREAVLYLTGLNMRELYGQNYRVKEDITVQDLLARTQHVIGREIEVVREPAAPQRRRPAHGTGRFVGPAHVVGLRRARRAHGHGEHVVIATGRRRPGRRGRVRRPPDPRLRRHPHPGRIPRSLVVVGAGVIGIEYASMFAALGSRVTVVEQRDRMLDFCDSEVVEALKFHLRDLSVCVPVRREGRLGRGRRARHGDDAGRAASGSRRTR
jgi:NAD(P) transhydrogenase